jgi:RimJ/RimL family protein N-acetyltransferase
MPPFDDLRLETPRLILRPPRLEDLDAWSAMMLDEPAARFIGGVMPRAVCWRQLMAMIGSWHALGFAMFGDRKGDRPHHDKSRSRCASRSRPL